MIPISSRSHFRKRPTFSPKLSDPWQGPPRYHLFFCATGGNAPEKFYDPLSAHSPHEPVAIVMLNVWYTTNSKLHHDSWNHYFCSHSVAIYRFTRALSISTTPVDTPTERPAQSGHPSEKPVRGSKQQKNGGPRGRREPDCRHCCMSPSPTTQNTLENWHTLE